MTRANVRVRPAGHADVPAVLELLRLLDPATGRTVQPRGEHRPDGADGLTRLHAALDAGHVVLVAAGDDGVLEGALVARCEAAGPLDLTPALHVTHLVVSPLCRRRGIGRSLLAGAVHVAEDTGAEHIMITALSGARDSNRYLARLGFAPMVVHRMAPTAALRRSLGMTDVSSRVAVLRRARRLRTQRSGLGARGLGHGA